MQAGRTCLGSCDARRRPEITPFARKQLGAELVSHREEKGRWVFAWELAGNGQNCRVTRLKQQVERGVVKNGCDWPWCAGMHGRSSLCCRVDRACRVHGEAVFVLVT